MNHKIKFEFEIENIEQAREITNFLDKMRDKYRLCGICDSKKHNTEQHLDSVMIKENTSQNQNKGCGKKLNWDGLDCGEKYYDGRFYLCDECKKQSEREQLEEVAKSMGLNPLSREEHKKLVAGKEIVLSEEIKKELDKDYEIDNQPMRTREKNPYKY